VTLHIDQEPPQTSRCDCCGGVTTNLTRFVYQDGDAYAAYCAKFSNNHTDGIVSILVGFGEWGEGTAPENRVVCAAQIRIVQRQFQVMVVDADQSIWSTVTVMGQLLTRAEALSHPLLSELFALTDRIVHDDREVHAYLERVGEVH
jgi:hypothetical protein